MNLLGILRRIFLVIAVALAVTVHAQERKAATPTPDPHASNIYGNTDPQIYGRWETVIPRADGAAIGKVLGMQTVHTLVLPSGKVLLASGSSWRNHAPVQAFPLDRNPQPGSGVLKRTNIHS